MKLIAFAIALLILLAVVALPAQADPLKVGDPAPAVTGTADTGAPLNFADFYKRQKYTLVYFFPKAFTSGCTKQGCSIRDAYAELTAKGIAVIGVSTDSVAQQAKFKAADDFPFTLIADPDKVVIGAFGVPTRSIPGLGSIAVRQAYLIRDGKIVWCEYKASTSTQAADVLKAVADFGG